MLITTKQPKKEDLVSILNLDKLSIFRLYKKGATKESDIVDGEIFMKIAQEEDISHFIKIGGDYTLVNRKGPLQCFKLETETSKEYSKKEENPLSNFEVGEGINIYNSKDVELIVKDPIDSKGYITTINIRTGAIQKYSPEVLANPVILETKIL